MPYTRSLMGVGMPCPRSLLGNAPEWASNVMLPEEFKTRWPVG